MIGGVRAAPFNFFGITVKVLLAMRRIGRVDTITREVGLGTSGSGTITIGRMLLNPKLGVQLASRGFGNGDGDGRLLWEMPLEKVS